MKQSALDFMKTNMGALYDNYYRYDTEEWILDQFNYDPFEVFADVPDFELAELSNRTPGEADLRNCILLYSHLNNLSDSAAADERLWAGLCNRTFYPYLRQRWKYAQKRLKKPQEDASAILTRFFYRTSGRSGMYRNTLARCWWTGRLTYEPESGDPWELLDAIGAEDFLSRVNDIFYSNTFSSNAEILKGFCMGLKYFRDHKIHITTKEYIRPTAQYLNALGGALLLDMFSAEEIRKLVIDRIGLLRQCRKNHVDPGLLEDPAEADDSAPDAEAEEAEIAAADGAAAVNLDYGAYQDALEGDVEIDPDSVLGAPECVACGCDVELHKTPEDTFFTSHMPLADGTLNLLQKKLLDRKTGESVQLDRSSYTIVKIRRR